MEASKLHYSSLELKGSVSENIEELKRRFELMIQYKNQNRDIQAI
jgi:hypothetical protein